MRQFFDRNIDHGQYSGLILWEFQGLTPKVTQYSSPCSAMVWKGESPASNMYSSRGTQVGNSAFVDIVIGRKTVVPHGRDDSGRHRIVVTVEPLAPARRRW